MAQIVGGTIEGNKSPLAESQPSTAELFLLIRSFTGEKLLTARGETAERNLLFRRAQQRETG
jgi:hypothetical protein